jgi:hypothetical protein
MYEGATREWRWSQAAIPMVPRVRSGVAEGMAREWRGRPWNLDLELEEMMRLENGDGGRDGDFFCFYVAIILPQMPLSKIDGVVNLFSIPRAKERL